MKMSIGLLDVLLIVFIVMKLCGVIAWSWAVVLIPLWIEIGILVISIVVVVYAAGKRM